MKNYCESKYTTCGITYGSWNQLREMTATVFIRFQRTVFPFLFKSFSGSGIHGDGFAEESTWAKSAALSRRELPLVLEWNFRKIGVG